MAEAARPSAADNGRADFDFSEDEADEPSLDGTVIVDRYRILSRLGAGGMGTVYLAEHLAIGRRVAVKVLNGEWSGHNFVARRFKAEARIASTIGHPNIVEVFDAGELPDRRLFLVMEHLDGHDLAQEIADMGTLSPLRTAEILRQVALALAAAHNVSVIHRDLKPGNVMIAEGAGGEIVKILDFGIACSPRNTARDGQRLTIAGSVMGTPEYMAPEQSTSAEPTPRFDLYALGVIAFEMLTGDPPLLSEHAYELLVRKRKEPAPSLATRVHGLHPQFIALVDDCLQIVPSRRPLDAIEFIHRLDAFIDELGDDPRPLAGPDAPTRPPTPLPPRPRSAAPRSLIARAPTPERLSAVPRITPRSRHWLPLALSVAALALGTWLLMSIFDLSPPPPIAEVVPPTPTVPAVDPPRRPLGIVEPLPVTPPPLPTPDPTISTPTPVPDPKPISTPTISTPPKPKRDHTTAECERHRTRAEDARRTQAWQHLRDLAKKPSCWSDDTQPRKLLTKALMELKDFSGCLTAARGLKDKEVTQWRNLCQARAG